MRLPVTYRDLGVGLTVLLGTERRLGWVRAGGVSGTGPIPYWWPATLGGQGALGGRCDLDRGGLAAVERVAERSTVRG